MGNQINRYEIILRDVKGVSEKSFTFDFQSHHDIIALIEDTKNSCWFENKNNNAQFVLGIRLFADLMVQESKNPLFIELLPAFKQFMKRLKASS